MSSPFPAGPSRAVPDPLRYGSSARPSHAGGWIAVAAFALAMFACLTCALYAASLGLMSAWAGAFPDTLAVAVSVDDSKSAAAVERLRAACAEFDALLGDEVAWSVLLCVASAAFVVTSIGVLRRSERMRRAAGFALIALTAAFAAHSVASFAGQEEWAAIGVRLTEAMHDIDPPSQAGAGMPDLSGANPATFCLLALWALLAVPMWFGLRSRASREWCGAPSADGHGPAAVARGPISS